MTELLLLLAFLEMYIDTCESLDSYEAAASDLQWMRRTVNFIESAKAHDHFADVITDLNRLDDAVISGLARKHIPFTFNSTVFRRMPKSVLPCFYYGPLSRIFDDQGYVKKRVDIKSVQFVLESLRLVRRAKHKAFTKKAADKAAQKFIAYQLADRPGNDAVLEKMSTMWSLFENASDFYDSIKRGTPGNGVTQDMRFPYVPDLCYLDFDRHATPRSIVSGFNQKAFNSADPYSGSPDHNFDHVLGQCQFVGKYQKPDRRIASLSVVDKKFDEGRAITVTNTACTIEGASLRESIFYHHRLNGSISMVNIYDQSSSQKVVEEHFHSISCVDLEGGSSCLTITNLDRMLSKTTYSKEMWASSRPTGFKWKNTEYNLSTLTMGDASSVALLTTTLWLVMVLAYMIHNGIPLHSWGYRTAVKAMVKDGRFRTVGDDMIFPDRLYNIVAFLLGGIGVTINQKKTSRAKSLFKESCGCHVVSDNNRGVGRIYPNRAAVSKTKDYPSVTQVIEQFVDKTQESPFARELFLAHTKVLLPIMGDPEEPPRIHYEGLLSFHPSIVGTRFGTEWSHIYRTVRGNLQHQVDDAIAYSCGFEDSLCTPRWTRRPDVTRFRVRRKSSHLGVSRSIREHNSRGWSIFTMHWALAQGTRLPILLKLFHVDTQTDGVDRFSRIRWSKVRINPHYVQRIACRPS